MCGRDLIEFVPQRMQAAKASYHGKKSRARDSAYERQSWKPAFAACRMRLVTRFCSLFAPFNLTPYFCTRKHRYNNQKPCPGEANLRYGLKSHWTTGDVIRLHLPSSCSSRWPVGRCCWEIWTHPYRFDACSGSQPSARLILWSNQGAEETRK